MQQHSKNIYLAQVVGAAECVGVPEESIKAANDPYVICFYNHGEGPY